MTILDEDFFKMRGMWAKDKKKKQQQSIHQKTSRLVIDLISVVVRK